MVLIFMFSVADNKDQSSIEPGGKVKLKVWDYLSERSLLLFTRQNVDISKAMCHLTRKVFINKVEIYLSS